MEAGDTVIEIVPGSGGPRSVVIRAANELDYGSRNDKRAGDDG